MHMLSPLVTRDEIKEAQTALVSLMQSLRSQVDQRDISYRPSGVKNQKVLTFGGYWYKDGEVSGKGEPSPRFLNWFGIRGPGQLRIAVEVNILREGIKHRVRGFFAKDNTTGAVYLMHSGDVGGGIRGVNGRAFRVWYRDQYGEDRHEVFFRDGKVRLGFIVILLNGSDPTRYAWQYVDRITKFKKAVANNQVDVNDATFQQQIQELKKFEDFYTEPRGRRTGTRSGTIDYISYHGEVVDALRSWRSAQLEGQASRIVKDKFIDMGLEDAGGTLIELYEVKPRAARADIYSAIGQLMVHERSGCKKFIVLPEGGPLAVDLDDALKRHGIIKLQFRLGDSGASISDVRAGNDL